MSWMADARYGARMFAKTPGTTAAAVLTLAVAIGVNTAVFSIIDAAMLRPFPYADPGRLMWIDHTIPKQGIEGVPASFPNIQDWRERTRTCEHLTAFRWAAFTLTGGAEPQRVPGLRTSATLFDLLGVMPALGRGFASGDDRPGAPAIAVISHGLWQRQYGGRPAALGRTIELDGEPHTIVGIMPPGFQFPEVADIWVPLRTDERTSPRQDRAYRAVARLRPGATQEQAQAELTGIAAALEREYPADNAGLSVRVIPLRQFYIDDERAALVLAFAAVVLVFVIACTNVAALLLARAAAREKEMAVRAALGAGRARLARQTLVESMLLALAAAPGAVLLARLTLDLILALIPMRLPFWLEFRIDGRVLAFTAAACFAAATGFGSAPIWSAWRVGLFSALREAGAGGSGRRAASARSALVVAQVALAVLVLTSASLLVRTLLRMQAVETGFRPAGVLTTLIDLPLSKYDGPQRQAALFQALTERARALPGVEAASLTSSLPLRRGYAIRKFTNAGQPAANPASVPMAAYRSVGPGYFEALGVPLLAGRLLDDTDGASAPGVAVISRSMAERFWPGRSALGERIKLGAPDEQAEWLTVVGVVGDVRHAWFGADMKVAISVPFTQAPASSMTLVVRGRTGAELAAAIRAAVRELDPDLPLAELAPMQQVVADSFWKNRLYAAMFAVFGVVALLLAAGGVFALTSYTVALRTREMAVRMALGASGCEVQRLAVTGGMRFVLAGGALGLVAAFPAVRAMRSLLFGVSPSDPITFVAVPLLIAVAALAACILPARRAARVDPVTALRGM